MWDAPRLKIEAEHVRESPFAAVQSTFVGTYDRPHVLDGELAAGVTPLRSQQRGDTPSTCSFNAVTSAPSDSSSSTGLTVGA